MKVDAQQSNRIDDAPDFGQQRAAPAAEIEDRARRRDIRADKLDHLAIRRLAWRRERRTAPGPHLLRIRAIVKFRDEGITIGMKNADVIARLAGNDVIDEV